MNLKKVRDAKSPVPYIKINCPYELGKIIDRAQGQVTDGIGEGDSRECRLFVYHYQGILDIDYENQDGKLAVAFLSAGPEELIRCIWTVCKFEREDKGWEDRNHFYEYLDADWHDICKLNAALKQVDLNFGNPTVNGKPVGDSTNEELAEYGVIDLSADPFDSNEWDTSYVVAKAKKDLHTTETTDPMKSVFASMNPNDHELFEGLAEEEPGNVNIKAGHFFLIAPMDDRVVDLGETEEAALERLLDISTGGGYES